MVQKYRGSAAPRYIYKINTPFRQNKLPQKNLTFGIKKEKSKGFTKMKICCSSEHQIGFFSSYHILLSILLYLEYLHTINIFQFLSK